jgi:hypothetical protein
VARALQRDQVRAARDVRGPAPGAVDTGLVSTVEIAGVDRSRPAIQKATARFRRHATAPEQAAERILAGIERNRYWVYTSRDIQIGHFLQRRFETPYVLIMPALSRRFAAIMGAR